MGKLKYENVLRKRIEVKTKYVRKCGVQVHCKMVKNYLVMHLNFS